MDEAGDTRGQRVDLHADFLSTCLTPVKYIILKPVSLLTRIREISSPIIIDDTAQLKFI